MPHQRSSRLQQSKRIRRRSFKLPPNPHQHVRIQPTRALDNVRLCSSVYDGVRVLSSYSGKFQAFAPHFALPVNQNTSLRWKIAHAKPYTNLKSYLHENAFSTFERRLLSCLHCLTIHDTVNLAVVHELPFRDLIHTLFWRLKLRPKNLRRTTTSQHTDPVAHLGGA